MYTDAEIAAAETPGRAAAMWWARGLWLAEGSDGSGPVNSFDSGELQTFENSLARAINKLLLKRRSRKDLAQRIVLVASPGGIVCETLSKACKKAGFGPDEKRWPRILLMQSSEEVVFIRGDAGVYEQIWPYIYPIKTASALAA